MRFPFFPRPAGPPPRLLIVGLGNPGPEYAATRHNVGFLVVERLARRHEIWAQRLERRALVGQGLINEMPVVLARPQTYMNLSGESVAPLMRKFSLTPEAVLVVTDDLDLPVGRIRIRKSGSPGGHNGLKSLVEHLDTEDFPRVRIGVGRPRPDVRVIDHVLTPFEAEEEPIIDAAVDRAADAVEDFLADGADAAMSRFNGK